MFSDTFCQGVGRFTAAFRKKFVPHRLNKMAEKDGGERPVSAVSPVSPVSRNHSTHNVDFMVGVCTNEFKERLLFRSRD